MSDPETNMSGDNDSDGVASLDHTLLESLFYNEMMLLDESCFPSPDFMSVLTADGTLRPGISNGTQSQSQAQSGNGRSHRIVLSEKDASTLVEKALLQDFEVSSRTFTGPPETLSMAEPPLSTDYTSATEFGTLEAQQPCIQAPRLPETERIPQERAQYLVSQFATLASRLGISLPQNVLSSLRQQVEAKEAGDSNGQRHSPTHEARSFEGSSSTENSPIAHAPIVQQRLDSSEHLNSERKRNRDDSMEAAKVPLFSKRRKKARLSDCESKLAALKSENEMLKRHLDTIANKSQKFDQERKEAEIEMKRLIVEGAGPEKLNPLLSKFSQMYSDYGGHRHQELTFHLEQLERLAAPTNFTKMGLWTLGQNEGFYTDLKHNPIASILSKELGINPQQGRKILEQRQKIRDLSVNLKECFGLLAKLKSLCEHKQKVFHDRMSKCQEILTPLQVVKLLLWVDEHSNILETVCPGWGSERIQPTKDKKEKSG